MTDRFVQTESGNAAAPVYGFDMEEAGVPVKESVRFLMDTVCFFIVIAAWRLTMVIRYRLTPLRSKKHLDDFFRSGERTAYGSIMTMGQLLSNKKDKAILA